MKKYFFFILFFACLEYPSAIFSQPQEITLQRIDLTQMPEINIYMTVTGEKGNSILGLTEQEIEIRVDDILQKISSLKSALEGGEYLAIALLFDRSGSMKKALEQTKEGGLAFLKRMSEEDQIAIVSFDDEVRVDLNFSKDRGLLENAIKNIEVGKDTALYDAIKKALELLQNVTTKRQAIVILSDGKDNRSKSKKEELLTEAKNRGIPLFTIGLGSQIDQNLLMELSRESGGSFFKAASAENLLLLYQQIAEQLNNQYRLSFPLTFGQDEKWHKLVVKVKGRAGEENSVARDFIASKGPGVSLKTMLGFQRKIEKQNIFLLVLIGAFLGLGLGLLILMVIRLVRPDLNVFSVIGVGLLLSAIIFGAIIGMALAILE